MKLRAYCERTGMPYRTALNLCHAGSMPHKYVTTPGGHFLIQEDSSGNPIPFTEEEKSTMQDNPKVVLLEKQVMRLVSTVGLLVEEVQMLKDKLDIAGLV